MQQLVRDQDVLQERMDKLERQMRYIMLRLPVGITNPGRNKHTLRQPVALETLDDLMPLCYLRKPGCCSDPMYNPDRPVLACTFQAPF